MASTGLILRRNTKANLINNPPLVGEIVFAYDTNELGMIIDGNLLWRNYLDLISSVNGKIGDVVLDKTDIGLSNVDNTSDLNKPVSTATQTAINNAVLSSTNTSNIALQNHINDDSNPHDVTKEQVQLGNVDNTADIDKPLSTAMISALSLKLGISETSVNSKKLGGHIPDYFAIKSDTYSKNEIDNTVSKLSTVAYVDNILSYKADKTYVDTQDDNLQTLIGNNISNISTNKDNISSNDTDISNLQSTKADKTYVDTKDANIQSQVTSNGINITNIQNNYATKTYVQNEIQTATHDATTQSYVDKADTNLQNQINTNITDITNLSLKKADKTYVDTRDANIQSQVTTNTNNISSNDTDISNLQSTKADKTYVDSVVSGLDFKDSVRVSSIDNLTLSGLPTIDGITVQAGDRVLVKDQTDSTKNGIYVASTGSWSRSTDADNTPSNEVSGGMFCFVEDGATNSGTGWVLRSPTGNAVLGTDDLLFSKFTDTVLNAGEILTKLKTVDGSGSGLDADLLDGRNSSFYQNATNLNTGTISDARLPSTISSDITGNSATSTKLQTARTISFGGDLSGSALFDGSSNIVLSGQVANNSHTHDQNTVSNSADSDKLNGLVQSIFSTPSTIVERDNNGDINARLFKSEYDSTNANIGYIMTQVNTASDNYIRPSTPAQLRTALNVENGATADQSASEILTALKTVDGSGSGLDADLLDGLEGSKFIRSDINYSFSGVLSTSGDNDRLIFQPQTSGGQVSIRFNSKVNSESDYGYLRWYDDNNSYNKWGDSTENGAIVLGIRNDVQNSTSDVVALESPAGIFLNAPDVYVGDKSTLHNITANKFIGTSTSAEYADLAEIYTCFEILETGTVVTIPKDDKYEVQKCVNELPFGVVSDKPGYLLDANIKGVPIALVGKTPVLVKGPIEKGDIVKFEKNGYCSKGFINDMGIIGRALETNISDNIELVKCAVRFL